MSTATIKKESPKEPTVEVPVLPVSREGNRIVLPADLSLDQAIAILKNRKEHDEQTIQFVREFEDVPWADAAVALYKAMRAEFHWIDAKATEATFFAPSKPPRIMKVKSGANGETVNIAVGDFALAAAENAICSINFNGRNVWFAVSCKRKYESRINAMLDFAERSMQCESLYRGKAVEFSMTDGNIFEEPAPDISFMALGDDKALILSDDVERDLRANIWTLLRKPNACRRLGIPTKRAVLVYGTYGVGKTLAAYRTAMVTHVTGHTFVYVADSIFLNEAYKFAIQMSPSVLFVEDIDRHLSKGDFLADLSNILDGINTKDSGVVLVATTNHVDKIPAVLLRPGRIDASIEVPPPDAATVKRLIEYYAPSLEGDTTAGADLLAGNIPAVVREACERAKLFALAADRQNPTGDDLADAARSMKRQMELLQIASTPKGKLSTGDLLHQAIHHSVRTAPPENGAYAK